jgi:hypothetical protein
VKDFFLVQSCRGEGGRLLALLPFVPRKDGLVVAEVRGFLPQFPQTLDLLYALNHSGRLCQSIV